MSTKRITNERNRLQSKLLVIVAGTLLVPSALYLLLIGGILDRDGAVFIDLLLSWTFAGVAWALSAATKSAAVWGGIICLVITLTTGAGARFPFRSGLAPLATLFVLTFLATRLGRSRKSAAGLAEPRQGRSASQVIANLGMAAITAAACSSGLFDRFDQDGVLLSSTVTDALPILLLAALCEATADTVSSEIGQAYGGTPIMITTARKMREGTNGAITLIGTGTGVLAAAVVAVVGRWGMTMRISHTLVALTAGILGCFFDSLLGATVEREGWLGNDLVNFSSTAFAVGAALLMVVLVSP